MTNETRTRLKEIGDFYFKQGNTQWNLQDLKLLYSLHNELSGSNKVDTGCGSCRREVINYVREQWLSIQ